tara:strand:- start:587 stop:1438 length:852 start_codon:yes stop_codon:yes gene_type:complete
MQQTHAAVVNALNIGGATCQGQVEFDFADTLSGVQHQSLNRGAAWHKMLRAYPLARKPGIVVLGAMAHVIPQTPFGAGADEEDAPYRDVVEDVASRAAAFDAAGDSTRFVWKTANPPGCTARAHIGGDELSSTTFLSLFDKVHARGLAKTTAKYPLHVWDGDDERTAPRGPHERSVPRACARMAPGSIPGMRAGNDCGWERFPRRDAWTVGRLRDTVVEVLDVRPLYLRGDAYVERVVFPDGTISMRSDCLHMCNTGRDPLARLVPPMLMHMLERWAESGSRV